MRKILLFYFIIGSCLFGQSLNLRQRIVSSNVIAAPLEIFYSGSFDGTRYLYNNTAEDVSKLDLNSANYLEDYNSDFTVVYESDFSADVMVDNNDGWSYNPATNEYDCDGTQTTASTLYLNGIMTYGEDYYVQGEITNYVTGSIRIGLNDYYSDTIQSNGTYSYVVTDASTTTIGFSAGLDFVGSVANISVYPLHHYTSNGDTEISFANDEMVIEVDKENYYESDFSVNFDGYVEVGVIATANQDAVSDGVVSKDDCLLITASGGAVSHYLGVENSILGYSNGERFIISGWYYIPSANTKLDRMQISNGQALMTGTTVGSWTYFTENITATDVFAKRIRLYDNTDNAFNADGDSLYIYGITVQPQPKDTDYVAISQDNFTQPVENDRNYTLQYDTYSPGTAVEIINKPQWSDSSYWGVLYSPTTIYTDSIVFNGSGNLLRTPDIVEDGKAYEYYIRFSNFDSGTIWFYDAAGDAIEFNSAGEYSGIYNDSDYDYDNGLLQFYALAPSVATIDSFWVKEITYPEAYVKLGNGHGVDLVTNGDFSDGSTGWQTQSGWTISNGVATCDGTDGSQVYQDIGADDYLPNELAYFVVEYDITSYTSGTVRSKLNTGVSVTLGEERSAVGSYKDIIARSIGADGHVHLLSSDFVGSVDNIKAYAIGKTIQTTGTKTTNAYTFKADSTGNTVLDRDNINSINFTINGTKTDYLHELSSGGYSIISKTGQPLFSIGKTYQIIYDIDTSAWSYWSIYNCELGNTSSKDAISLANTNILDTLFFTATYEGLCIYMGGDAPTVTYSNFSIQELPSLEIYPKNNGIIYTDNFKLMEQYDLEADIWFRAEGLANETIFSLGGIGTFFMRSQSDNKIYHYLTGNAGSGIAYTVDANTGAWHNVNLSLSMTEGLTLKLNGQQVKSMPVENIYHPIYMQPISNLLIGSRGSELFRGNIGQFKVKTTDGLGNIVGYSLWDWKGDANNYPKDKGINGIDLIDVNGTVNDNDKYYGSYK